MRAGHFIVYDYLPGTRPLSALSELGPVAPRRVCEMALQVLYALDTLHRAGVVHGDVSLNNCLWRERDGGRDEVRLCDLGCAWARSPSSVVTGGPTEVSDSRGSAYCTAPEILNDEAGDHRADLWSVGAIMYALMTMRDVDLGDPEEPLEIKPPASLVPKIPKAISDVVMRALAPAEQRYPSAAAMVEAIRAALATPSAKRGLPLWASIAGMALTAGLATIGSLVSMANAHDDASPAPSALASEPDAHRGDASRAPSDDASAAQSTVPPAAGDRRITEPAPSDAPAAEPDPTEPAPTAGAAISSKSPTPHPAALTWSAVEKAVMKKAAALRSCSSDDFISLGLRVANGKATLESLDGAPPSLPRDRCAVDVVSGLPFAKSDDPLAGVVGVKLPDPP
jgi:serine/threonine protein kinase